MGIYAKKMAMGGGEYLMGKNEGTREKGKGKNFMKNGVERFKTKIYFVYKHPRICNGFPGSAPC